MQPETSGKMRLLGGDFLYAEVGTSCGPPKKMPKSEPHHEGTVVVRPLNFACRLQWIHWQVEPKSSSEFYGQFPSYLQRSAEE